MLKSIFRIVFRTMRRRKTDSLINILGLAVGLGACLLIFTFIRHEIGFDRMHDKADRIYRLNEIQSFRGISPQHVPLTMFPMAPALQAAFPEVDEVVRFRQSGANVILDGRPHALDNAVFAGRALFRIFDFNLQIGDPDRVLADPNTVVLTASAAQKLFGTRNPIGEILQKTGQDYAVTGIVDDPPPDSHLQFDALFSVATMDSEERRGDWGSNYMITYVLLHPSANLAAMHARFPDFLRANLSERSASLYELYLQPLTDIHLGSMHITHDYLNFQKSDRKTLWIFGALGAFLLCIAGVNFTNLSIARSAMRAKEIGVRKAIGAGRGNLRRQFLGESIALTAIAAFAGGAIAYVFLPYLNVISNRQLTLGFLGEPEVLALFLVLIAVIGAVAGLYPALYLASFRPVAALQAKIEWRRNRSGLRNALVISQFVVAMTLIAATVFTTRQFEYLRDRSMGFDREHIVTLPMNQTANQNFEAMRIELRKDPSILDVTASSQRLGNNIHQYGARARGDSAEVRLSSSHLHVDLNYLDFYGLKILHGRGFSSERVGDKQDSYILNESLAADLGWSNPVGRQFRGGWRDSMGTVIGVVEDFNFNSLHHAVQPSTSAVRPGTSRSSP